MRERMPTFNQEAEEAVLGSIALEGTRIAQVADWLEPSHFLSPQHQTVYSAMLSLYRRGDPIDPITIQTELQRKGLLGKAGGAQWVQASAFLVAHAAYVEHYAKIVKTNGEKLALAKQLQAAFTMACRPDTTIEDCWAAIPQQTRMSTAYSVHSIQLPHSHARSR